LFDEIPRFDPLFPMSENAVEEFSRHSPLAGAGALPGALPLKEIAARVRALRQLSVDDYVRAAVFPSEDSRRIGAQAVIRRLDSGVSHEIERGPLYAARATMEFPGGAPRVVGILAQERRRHNGVWMPEHHRLAVEIIRDFASRGFPIVTFMDTPGADASQTANRQNQAHSISRLIAEFAQLGTPTVGVILGAGYSGGAIPLATVNLLLCVRDGVFNTIQPRGLANIARKYDLSWQACAHYVGVSSYELCDQGIVDAVVDFAPGESQTLPNLSTAIVHGILAVERAAKNFVKTTPEVFEQYRRTAWQYIDPSEQLQKLQEAPLSRALNPGEQCNVFGCAFRDLRSVRLRGRLHFIHRSQYGRLSAADAPRGDLLRRTAEEHERFFHNWLDHPLEIKYDDALTSAWRRYLRRRADLSENYGRWRRALFGDSQKNFHAAMRDLLLAFGFHLLNQWKGSAQHNFLSLVRWLHDAVPHDATKITNPTVLDILRHYEVHPLFPQECENFLLFDLIYNRLLADMRKIALEAKERNVIERESVRSLFEDSLSKAAEELAERCGDVLPGSDWSAQLKPRFMSWVQNLARRSRSKPMLKKVEEWKKLAHPRISEPLFAVLTFYFEHLLPGYFEHMRSGRPYDGRIAPRNIGMRDFWNRLAEAYQDLLINEELQLSKRESPVTARRLLERFFSDFHETNGDLMSADPAHFPGFRASIEEALEKGVSPCGVLTGIGTLKQGAQAGVAISNVEFQAGAFDMAGAEKFCRLLVDCWRRRLPVIAFISSGGMQTKEGAAALASPNLCATPNCPSFVLDSAIAPAARRPVL
jgi:acetyl-CoA carboxylase alpha subunit